MAPHRRRALSSKLQQQHPVSSLPSQISIQRFFGKHPLRSPVLPPPPASSNHADTSPSEPVLRGRAASIEDVEVTPVARGTNKKPPLAVDHQRQDKRSRISPGMLTQQSQEDGWDQVVWRMSPTAERLQGISAVDSDHQTKSDAHVLHGNRTLCDATNVFSTTSNGPNAAARPGKKRSPGLAGKLEQWLTTGETDPPNRRDNTGANVIGLKSIPECITSQDTPNSCRQNLSGLSDKENDGVVPVPHVSSLPRISQMQRKRQMVSSSSRCRSLMLKTHKRKEISKQKGSGQRRKALLELLDQVQNVISVPESSSSLDKSCEDQAFQPTKYSERVGAAASNHQAADATPPINSASTVEKVSRTDADASEALANGQISAPCFLEAEPEMKSLQCVAHTSNGIDDVMHQVDTDLQMSNKGLAVAPEALASIHFLVLEIADLSTECSELRTPTKILRLLNEHSGVERVLYLVDEWFFTVVRPGDTVNVIGEFDMDGKCIIDRNTNLLIVHPDVLISGSKVGSSFSCPRRAVLDERIRSRGVAFPALLGTMMHQLFQIGLVSKVTSKVTLEKEAEVIVQQNIDSLYACGANEREALGKLKDSIPTILNWLDSFLLPSVKAPVLSKVDFGRKDGQLSISISEVIDIEEMIYSPKFGLKGMIDASLRVKRSCMNLNAEKLILPLEFKTGKGTTGQAALEHRAQVILYSLLMSDRYSQSIDKGLLYYLYTNQTQGVAIQRTDLVGLIMRRNEHAANLLSASLTQHLPPMIKSMHMCQSCWHLDACSIYHKAHEGGTIDSSGIGELFYDRTGHLSGPHFEFLKLWDRLIDLEAQDLQASQKEIWRLPSWQREESGRCFASMRLTLLTKELLNETKADGFVYHFCRDASYADQSNCIPKGRRMDALHEHPFSCGDHVLLSTESGHIAVAAGVISDITESSVMIRTSHQLQLHDKDGSSNKEQLLRHAWRIDKDETASFLATMRFNVLQLFLKSNGHEHGRQLIVDLKPPKFDIGGFLSQDSAASYVLSTPDLNDDQRRAIFKILSARDYTLVLGMPGTGKTSTIVHAVRALITRGSSILLTSYTNSAVDNVLLKLKSQGVDFVRLGREAAIHPELKDHVIEGLGLRTVKEVELRMNEVHIIAATCLGVSHPLLTNRKFDVCIVDEAGQITLPVCLGPLRFANTFVLVGDHYQLPPLVRNAEAREKGLAVSLFRRLSEAHPQAISALQCQYRMCAGIMGLCNALIYGNRLRCGSPEVANAQLKIKDTFTCQPAWLQKTIDGARSVVVLNTDLVFAHETNIRTAVHNTTEAFIVLKVIKTFLDGGLDAKDIGVISPYNYQVQHIRRLLAADGLTMLEVQTIDRFQGRDKDCMLVSFVKSTNQGRSSATLLADWHRINVAITRAKKKLILIGSLKTLSATPVLHLLIKQVEQSGGLVHIPQEVGLLVNGLRRCNQQEVEGV